MKVYGIRHHGPGCARSLLHALEQQQPDVILVEAPAEAEALFPDAAHEEMKPPVAALLYQSDSPQQAAFYPFARFSPEWQALQWGLKHQVPVKGFDLPAANSFALAAKQEAELTNTDDLTETTDNSTADVRATGEDFLADPLEYFARADGYSDGERWWNDKVEERSDPTEFFEAILEALTALREELGRPETTRTLQREAWMRRRIRAAKKEGYENLAVVCGAWHAPVLVNTPKVSEDNALLKGLPKVKVSSTWTLWTYERLTSASGYGAGIRSPGWYDHLWSQRRHPFVTWMTKAARVLRKEDFEGSSASIIEATRLAESLAGIRGRPQPGLDESLEAMRTVYCAGDAAPLALLQKPLLVGRKLGSVPDDVSNLPLQRDIEALMKSLRLKPAAEGRDVELDLRENSGLNRSVFLHRLVALNIRYAEKRSSRSKGTFKEAWHLNWRPGTVLDIVDASRFGNTLITASGNALLDSNTDASVEDISWRFDLALLAHLSDIAPKLVKQLEHSAASTSDTLDLMQAVPTLVRIVRYGDVRNTDSTLLQSLLGDLTARVHVSLSAACSGLEEHAAAGFVSLLRRYAEALDTLQQKALLDEFSQSLHSVANNETSSPEPRGCATRLLYDASQLNKADAARHFSFALSRGNEPADAAAWLQGFLSGSGAVLVHEHDLLSLIDDWLKSLSYDAFVQVLPLLRRTFGQFSSPEKSRIGQVVQTSDLKSPQTAAPSLVADLDMQRARPALATVARLFDLPAPD